MLFLFDTLQNALKALAAHKARSALSVLGIVVGVLTVSSLLTIALGVKKEIVGNIEGLGKNLIAVVPGKIDNGKSINFFAQVGASSLTEEDFHAIKREVPEAQNVSLAMILTGSVQRGNTTLPSAIIGGGSPGVEKALNISLARGRLIEERDEETRARVVILGAAAATVLFPGEDPVGKEVEIRGERFRVIGVLEPIPTAISLGGADLNTIVFMPIHTSWEITGTQQIFRIMMQAPDTASVPALQEKVRRVLLETHKGEEDFTVFTQEDIVRIVSEVLNVLTNMLGLIAAISLLVGGIGIMNIMLVAVGERTKEIGIRKAVGATRFAILLQFLAESVILTVSGGMLALVVFAAGVNVAASRFPFPLEVDGAVVLLALVFSAAVGLVFGVVPAYRASRKDPVEALRYE